MKVKFTIILFLLFRLAHTQQCSKDSIVLISHNVLAFSGHPKSIHTLDSTVFNKAFEYYKDSDIIALQESPSEKYIKALADSLELNYAFFSEKFKGNEEYPYGFPGAILSRYRIKESFDFNQLYPQIADTLFQRHWGAVILETPLGDIRVTTIHLCASWGGRDREQTRLIELDFLFKYLTSCDSCIADFLVGDFNSQPESDPYEKIISKGYSDAHKKFFTPTVPVPDSKYKIDYIFYKADNIEINPLPVVLPFYKDSGLYLSDHVPCKASIQLVK